MAIVDLHGGYVPTFNDNILDDFADAWAEGDLARLFEIVNYMLAWITKTMIIVYLSTSFFYIHIIFPMYFVWLLLVSMLLVLI